MTAQGNVARLKLVPGDVVVILNNYVFYGHVDDWNAFDPGMREPSRTDIKGGVWMNAAVVLDVCVGYALSVDSDGDLILIDPTSTIKFVSRTKREKL